MDSHVFVMHDETDGITYAVLPRSVVYAAWCEAGEPDLRTFLRTFAQDLGFSSRATGTWVSQHGAPHMLMLSEYAVPTPAAVSSQGIAPSASEARFAVLWAASTVWAHHVMAERE
jgi:hypothetical protein